MVLEDSFLPGTLALGKDAGLNPNILTSSNCGEVCNHALTAQAGAAPQHALKAAWEHVPSGWNAFPCQAHLIPVCVGWLLLPIRLAFGLHPHRLLCGSAWSTCPDGDELPQSLLTPSSLISPVTSLHPLT